MPRLMKKNFGRRYKQYINETLHQNKARCRASNISMKQYNNLIIYTDGGSRGNPGPAAIGVVICDDKGNVIKKYSEYLGETTNNEAEYQAVIFAMKKIKHLLGKKKIKNTSIEIRSDSELLINQLNGKFKIQDKKIANLFIKIWNLKIDFGPISFEYAPREENREADRLVNEALNKQQSNLL